jgi:AbiV family abortive infection protein
MRPVSIPRSSCDEGCRLILKRTIAYTEAAEYLFSVGRKQEAYVLSFLAMDECGKFILIAKELRSSTADPINVTGFSDHDTKYGEVLDNNKRLLNSVGVKIALELSKGLDLSEIAKLNYQAIANNSILPEARKMNTDPLRYRNEAFYVDFIKGWRPPRYPSDELCAAQIKLVKGAAKSYLTFIETEGLQWLIDHSEYFADSECTISLKILE